ncbi:MAG: ATP-binding protein, partial [Gemmatimonadota bacterium]|nr:ATP-binding protein [Gemmatimonadota bacterium]
MATAEQIKSLIRSYIIDDSEHFVTIALQVAAHEARLGHGALAHDIRKLVDKAKQERGSFRTIKFPQDLRGLVISEKPSVSLSSLVLLESLRKRIDRIIFEYRQQNKLKTHGLSNRRKILLIGPPGTGKTMSAQVLAHELGLILHTVQVDKLVTKFMGETSAKLRQIFEFIEKEKGVFLFDEFDAIGGERSLENDVGEMRRVLNAFLQFIENDSSDSLIIAATNSPRNLDRALFRRFDDVLYYDNPSDDARKRLIRNVLGSFLPACLPWTQIGKESAGLSHAEIDYSCRD